MKELKNGLLVYGIITFLWLLLSAIDLAVTPIGQDPSPTNIVNFFLTAPLLYYLSILNMGYTIITAIIKAKIM